MEDSFCKGGKQAINNVNYVCIYHTQLTQRSETLHTCRMQQSDGLFNSYLTMLPHTKCIQKYTHTHTHTHTQLGRIFMIYVLLKQLDFSKHSGSLSIAPIQANLTSSSQSGSCFHPHLSILPIAPSLVSQGSSTHKSLENIKERVLKVEYGQSMMQKRLE